MKQFFGKKSRRALVLVFTVSLALHLVAILIFGTIQFVSAVMREETEFQAGPLDQPPQQQQEFEVNIEEPTESTPPPRPDAIVVNSPSELNIPSLDIDLNVDMRAVVARTTGGFARSGLDAVRETAMTLTDFGYTGMAEGLLEGTLIDLKRNKDGRPSGLNGRNEWTRALHEFTDGTWNLSRLTDRFYSAENRLYASHWIIPLTNARLAPESFGVGDEVEATGIIAFYEGLYKPTETKHMRFLGAADDVLMVRLNNRIVFDGSRPNYTRYRGGRHASYQPSQSQSAAIAGMNTPTFYSDWVTVQAGRTYDLKVIVGEIPGGQFGCMLFYQVRGDDRKRVFSTRPLTDDEKKRLRGMHTDIAQGL